METYSGYNIAVILFAAMGSLLSGYGLAVIIATVGQPTFYSSMNLVSDATAPGYGHTNTFISTIQGIFFAGGFFGSLVAGPIASRFGRIRGFQMIAAIGIFGGALQTGARNQGMYIAARFITGFTTGQAFAAMPVYFSEVAPPHSRGLMAGAHGCFINVGYAASNWIGFGTFNAPSSWGSFAWRFPNAVFVIWAVLFAMGTFFIPESPRWLVQKNKNEEALRVLCRLHHDRSDENESFARQELALIERQLEDDESRMKTLGRWQLITDASNRRRLILSIIVVLATQNTGILVINNYNALLYQSLGLSNSQALIVSAGYNTWGMVANFFGATISDRVGRRRLLLTGYVSTVVMFAIATGLLAKYTEALTRTWAALSLTFLFLYVFCYAAFIDVNCWTYAAEIFPYHLRAQGTGIGISSLFLADTLWLQLAPTASATIGWKHYLVFIALTLVTCVWFWFRLPETKGLALENMDAIFGGTPVGGAINDIFLDEEKPTQKSSHIDEIAEKSG